MFARRAASDADLARGETVVVVEGAERQAGGGELLTGSLAVLLRYLPPSAAAAAAAELTGARRNDAYARALEMAEKPARESP